jgi:cysteine-S-conjugate beta-lyase
MSRSPFDALTVDDLRRRRGVKWTQYPPDVLPAWIADLDFAPAPPIRRVLDEMVAIGDLGYAVRPWLNPLPALFAERQASRHGWRPDAARVRVLDDVLQAMEAALLHHGSPGDGVIVQTPIYPPFLEAVRTTRRSLVENRLIQVGAREGAANADGAGPELRTSTTGPSAGTRENTSSGWEVDLDGFRDAAKRARVFLLCNPHNPTGRVFGRAELEAMAEIAVKRDLVVFADEIHQDLLFPGHRHIPFASLGDEVARRTVTFTSATKSFNIAGLCCAVAHFGPDALLAAIDAFPPHYWGRVSIAGIEATAAAWREGDPWLAELLTYLDGNRQRLASFLRDRLPGIAHVPPEATFLAWLDCRALDLPGGPHAFFLERARVALSNGPDFGEAGRGAVRLNFATSRAILDQVLERMAVALASHERHAGG